MQPWFNHWAWVISAKKLAAHLANHYGDAWTGNVATIYLPADDDYWETLRTAGQADRLCHILQPHALGLEAVQRGAEIDLELYDDTLVLEV